MLKNTIFALEIKSGNHYGKVFQHIGYLRPDQIARYIAARNLSEGYLITFSFLKNKVVQEQPEWIEHEGKRIYEAVI